MIQSIFFYININCIYVLLILFITYRIQLLYILLLNFNIILLQVNQGSQLVFDMSVISNKTNQIMLGVQQISVRSYYTCKTYTGFIGTWTDFQSIKIRSFDKSGIQIGNDFQLKPHPFGYTDRIVCTSLQNNDILLSWKYSDWDYFYIYANILRQLSNNTIIDVSGKFRIDGGENPDAPSIAALGSKFIVAWIQNFKVSGQIYDNTGGKIGDKFVINTTLPTTFSYSNWNNEPHLYIQPISTSEYIAMWHIYTGSFNVYSQIMNKDVKVGQSKTINCYTDGDQLLRSAGKPSIVSLSSDKFFAVWDSLNFQDISQDRSASGVYGRIFKPDLTCQQTTVNSTANSTQSNTTGSGYSTQIDFLINNFTIGYQTFPAIAKIGTDSQIVVWASQQNGTQYNNNYNIFAQIFNSEGSKMYTQQFMVNDNETGYGYGNHQDERIQISVININEQNFAISWTAYRSNGNKHPYIKIYGQKETVIDPTLNPQTNSTIITPYLCAFFSNDVYKTTSQGLPQGWSVLKSMNDSDVRDYFNLKSINSNGYYGRAYIDQKLSKIVIAHKIKSIQTISEIQVDSSKYFQDFGSKLLSSKTFLDYVKDYIKSISNNTIEYKFTGHSLSACIAELNAFDYNLSAITFQSPGCKQLLNTGNGVNTTDLSNKYAKISIYNAAPNLLNSLAGQTGKVFRVHPSIHQLATSPIPQSGYASYAYYPLYSIQQNNMKHILQQFSSQSQGRPYNFATYQIWPSGYNILTGYTGYNHYVSSDQNTYYWSLYLQSTLEKNNIPRTVIDLVLNNLDLYKTSSKIFKSDTVKQLLKNVYEEIMSAVIQQDIKMAIQKFFIAEENKCVNITGNDKGNIIWGSTNFNDTIKVGNGNDTIYLFQGNDTCTDTGGFDTYILNRLIDGIKIIKDSDGNGKIIVRSNGFLNLFTLVTPEDLSTGNIYPIQSSKCPIMQVGSSYFLQFADSNIEQRYFLIQKNQSLFIMTDCIPSFDQMNNAVNIENFTWGNFGLTKDTNNDHIVLIGSNQNEVTQLDCTSHKISQCVIDGLQGDDTFIGQLGQKIKWIGSITGKKLFKIIDKGGLRRLLQQNASNDSNVEIKGIKQGDIIDLSSIISNNQVKIYNQNGTDCYIDVSNGYKFHASIIPGNSYVSFTLDQQGKVFAQNLNMTEVINQAINPSIFSKQISTASSSQNWLKTAGGIAIISAVSFLGLLLIVVVVFILCKRLKINKQVNSSKYDVPVAAASIQITINCLQSMPKKQEYN